MIEDLHPLGFMSDSPLQFIYLLSALNIPDQGQPCYAKKVRQSS